MRFQGARSAALVLLLALGAVAAVWIARNSSHDVDTAPATGEAPDGEGALAAAPAPVPTTSDSAVASTAARTLRGRVIAVGGGPAAGAEVSAYRLQDALGEAGGAGPMPDRTVTDAQGEFAFPNVAAGPYGLRARGAQEGVGALPYVRVAALGDTVVSLPLVAGVAIAGRVVDPQGAPIPGARVSTDAAGPLRRLYEDVQGRRFRVSDDRAATTDDRGAFVLAPLWAGLYGISVEAPGRVPRAGVSAAAPTDDLVVTLARGGSIRGVVTLTGGPRPTHVRLEVRPASREDEVAVAGDEVPFEVAGLAAGRYEIRASAAGYGEAATGTDVAEGAASDPVRLTLAAGTPVRGFVLERDGGSPVPEAEVRFAFVRRHGMGWSSRLEPSVRTDGRGAWTARLRPGEWILTAAKAGWSAPVGDEEECPVTIGTDPVERTLLLERSHAIEGDVRFDDGGPAGGVRVAVTQAGVNPAFPRGGPIGIESDDVAVTDEEGRFRLEGVAEYGRYAVTAEGPGGARATVENVVFEIGASVTRTRIMLQRTSETGARVEGRVLAEDGTPVAGAVVVFAGRTATTAADGTFSREHVPRGAHRARVTAMGFATIAPAPFEVSSASTLRLPSWTLPRRGCVVRGTLRTRRDEPVSGATVGVWFPLDERPLARSAVSDDRGRYVLEGPALGEGELTVQVSAPGFRHWERHVPVASDVTVDVALVAFATARAVLTFGGPVPDQVVVQQSGEGDFHLDADAAFDPVSGTLQVRRLPPGRRQLRLTAEGYAPSIVNDVEVEEGQSLDLGRIRMTRGGTVAGRVLAADGAPLAGVQVALDDSVFLQAETDEGGRFRLEHVPPGTWTASVNGIPGHEGAAPTFAVTAAEGKVTEADHTVTR